MFLGLVFLYRTQIIADKDTIASSPHFPRSGCNSA